MQDLWDEIEIAISQAIATNFKGDRRQSRSGGCINQAFTIANQNHRFFVKLNDAHCIEMFTAEAIALEQIAATKTMRVPQPICYGLAGDRAFLVLENLDLEGRGDWEAMGRNLAAMHRVSSDRGFGWKQNNVIGSTPQLNPWTDDWIEFWWSSRLLWQMKLARRKGWRCPVAEEQLYAAIPRFFQNYQPIPAMVHGDLWGGNVGFTQGEPVIFDPALYFGDREVDLAMTKLFGGFPQAFYRAYHAAYPLDAGYHQRQNLYNLYHILNHFNLFGGGYGSQSDRLITEIVSHT